MFAILLLIHLRRLKVAATLMRLVMVTVTLTGCAADVDFQHSDPGSQAANSGKPRSEEFTAGFISKKLDILFVVDNSGSMSEEQQKLGTKIDSFLDTLHDIDWQIAITTTDVSDGPFGIKGEFLDFEGTNTHVLTRNTPNYSQAFLNTITREESIGCTTGCASGNEQALRAMLYSIEKRANTNRGFFRNGADLGVMVLSDEDEMSTGPAGATSPQQVIDSVERAWNDDKKFLAYGMIIKPGDSACFNENNGAGNYGTFVNALSIATGGATGSLCAPDYAPVLGQLAENARRLLDYVQLKYTPQADSIQVTFSPEHIATWTLDRRRLYINPPPPKGTKIIVDYIVK